MIYQINFFFPDLDFSIEDAVNSRHPVYASSILQRERQREKEKEGTDAG